MAATTEHKSNSSSSHSISNVYLSDAAELKKVFDRFDINGDGKISADELIGVMKALGSETSPEEVDQMMKEMDSDLDGFINLEEFAEFCSKKVEGDESGSQELHDAFKMYDQDGDDLISCDELHQVLSKLGEHCSLEDCKKMIQSVDSDGDGNVSFEEFRKMMTKSKSASASATTIESYVAIYFAILFIRHRAGVVTDEMLAIPKSRFVLIGLLEALGLAGGMASAGGCHLRSIVGNKIVNSALGVSEDDDQKQICISFDDDD